MAEIDLPTQLQQLYQRFGDLPGVRIELHQNLVAVYVHSAKSEARVFLQGAQITHFQPHGQSPVLFMSEHNQFTAGQPLRGGIPISWPWFADLTRNPEQLQRQVLENTSAHGFLRTCLWQLDDIRMQGEDHQLQLSCRPQAQQWPYSASLSMVITVAESLSIELRVANVGDSSFNYTLALHSYYQVSDISQVAVSGLEGVQYLDALDEWRAKSIDGSITIAEEVDRVFEQVPQTITLIDKKEQRSIELTSVNLPSMVVWNPWVDKGNSLSHFGKDDFRSMLCLENAALLDNICSLTPGNKQSHLLNIKTISL